MAMGFIVFEPRANSYAADHIVPKPSVIGVHGQPHCWETVNPSNRLGIPRLPMHASVVAVGVSFT